VLARLDGRVVRREGSVMDELTTMSVGELSAIMRRMRQHIRPPIHSYACVNFESDYKIG
jgi:hypothetical protein